MVYSMGGAYAIRIAVEQANLKGLILCDYPAKYSSIPTSWSDKVISNGFIREEKKHVVIGIQKDSMQTELYHELSLLDIPVKIFKGGTDGSLLKESELEKYRWYFKDITICEIQEAGHKL
ncbi:hypothetical protein PB01_08985 [Psychrobacillus glaciei]|uniref:Alpha/beta hydrolase n=1 Tax=Psychrobacillus glaciei TaxID=2283160 RepID=A0A5J6SLZ1_9BACI|nr:hypothetical protein [Psychrobacillus glaciei]QFF98955.1 hypothetical protein PB01_08985 [Psychrobacillus glaciei]